MSTTTQKMKVGMLFRTTAPVDLTIIDFDGSPKYEKIGDMYFQDFSKEYVEDCWDIHAFKCDLDTYGKLFVGKHPNDDFEAELHLLLFDENGEVIQDVRLESKPKDLITDELKYSKQ